MKSPRHFYQPISCFWLIGTVLIFAFYSSVILLFLSPRTLTSLSPEDGIKVDLYAETNSKNPFSSDLIEKIRNIKNVEVVAELYSPQSESFSIKYYDTTIDLYSPNPDNIINITKAPEYNPLPGHMNMNRHSELYIREEDTITLIADGSEHKFSADYSKSIPSRTFYIHRNDLNRIFDETYISKILINIKPNLSTSSLYSTLTDLEEIIGDRSIDGNIEFNKDALSLHYKLVTVCFVLSFPVFIFPTIWVIRRAKRLTKAYQIALAEGSLPALPRHKEKRKIRATALSMPLAGVVLGIGVPYALFVYSSVSTGVGLLSALVSLPLVELGLFFFAAVLIFWVLIAFTTNDIDVPYGRESSSYPNR